MSSKSTVSSGSTAEYAANLLKRVFKRIASFTIESSLDVNWQLFIYVALNEGLKEVPESERTEVQSVVQDMIKICVERRNNEKTYLDCINHEVKDMLKTYLDRINHEVLDMLKTYLERWNHESRESARPQSEEEEGINLSAEDMGTLVLCFNGDRETALKFLNQLSKIDLDRKKTDLVNMYVRAGKIKDRYKHRELWKLLSKNGLYNSTETNWNKRIF